MFFCFKPEYVNFICNSTVPQQRGLFITTEFGRMQVDPNEICVIQVQKLFCLYFISLIVAGKLHVHVRE